MTSICQRATELLLTLFLSAIVVSAQGTAFSYQGNLSNSGTPANGNFDFEFVLYNSISAGGMVALQSISGVAVTNGVFSVTLNYGNTFPGTNRFLEIRVKPAGGGSFTTLTPRQAIGSAPYSVRSLSAETADNTSQLGGVAASQYLVTGQSVINAGSQFQIGSDRVLGAPGVQNTFAGRSAGESNINTLQGGINNSFFGHNAGKLNTTGIGNSFFGSAAGAANSTGGVNSFFGQAAGLNNTTGTRNAFFGSNAGESNQTGNDNSIFGYEAGNTSSTASNNSFFGFQAGRVTTAINNSFFGFQAGLANTTGMNNSFFGVLAGHSNTTGVENAFFGRSAGDSNTTGNGNSFFGRAAGSENSSGANNTFVGINAGLSTTSGSNNTAIGANASVASGASNNNTAIGANASVSSTASFATAIGAGAVADRSNHIRIGREVDEVWIEGPLTVKAGPSLDEPSTIYGALSVLDDVDILGTLGIDRLDASSSNNHVCYNSNNVLVKCGVSSIRFKNNISTFAGGLEEIRRLKPVSFNWKFDDTADFGLIAEDVAKVEPKLASYDKDGAVEGVHYDRIGVLLINAVKEQQAQIEAQSKLIRQQQQQIDALKKLYSPRTRRLTHSRRRGRAR